MRKALLRKLQEHPGAGAALAAAALRGDLEVYWILQDYLAEQEIDVSANLQVGQTYYLETFTKYYVGRLIEDNLSYLVLDEYSWIPDGGRYHATFLNGTFLEVEPVPQGILLRVPHDAIAAIVDWPFPLPREVQ